jgi:L,D-peptidoglycan transpeptidase YkuD (ErfK/YbiS/YcfS/YnhG family)
VRARGVTRASILLALLSIVVAACGSGSSRARTQARSSTSRATTSTTIAPVSTTRAPTTTTTASTVPPTAATTSPPTTGAPPSTLPAPAPLLVTRLSGVGSSGQVIAVAAAGYGTSVATLTAYERGASGWTQVFGPWTANVGRNGVAPPGEKREGDGRTPSGTFGFDFMFGVNPNPGVKFPFRAITGTNIVWDDDPASANYNRWIDANTASAGVSPEPMYVSAYGSGAVIAYNDARTPGLGSAIFLHLSSGGSTAGCVALPSGELLPLLRWLDPTRQPRIAIGTLAQLTS